MMKKYMYTMLVILCISFIISDPMRASAETKEMIYISGMDYVFAVDPETKEVKNIKVDGAARHITWTKDGRTLFASAGARQKVAIIDSLKGEVIEEVSFEKDGYSGYIYGMDVDPEGNKLYATVLRTKVQGTEFKALPLVISVMDLKTKELIKEIEVPYGTHTLQFYEDGSKIAVWGRDLRVYDVVKDTLTLHKETMYPKDENIEGISNYLYFWIRDKDTDYQSLVANYTYHPDTGEETEGFITWDLRTGEVDKLELKEAPIGYFSAAFDKGKKNMYGGLNYLAKTNVAEAKHEKVVPTKLGSSYGFNISGDGKTVYVSGAGPDISFYDAETLDYIDTVELKSDTMDLRVVQIEK